MRKFISLIKKDITNAFRDKLLTYIIVAPIIMAILILLFAPSLDSPKLRFAIDNSVPHSFIAELEKYGTIESFNSFNKLEQRVLMSDDVPGIIYHDGGFEVILQGNEENYSKALPGVIIDNASQSESIIPIEIQSLDVNRSIIRNVLEISILVIIIIMGGAIMGLMIVEDKESKAIKSLAVSPLTTGNYLFEKAVASVIYSFVFSFVAAFIMWRFAFNAANLLVLIIPFCLFGVAAGFLIGIFANNQNSSIVFIKTLSSVVLAISIASVFVPHKLEWMLYVFPNFWAFKVLKIVFIDKSLNYFNTFLIAIITNSLLVLALTIYAQKKFKLR